MTVIKIVCCYCGKDMGKKDGNGIVGTSHSICEKCLKKQMKEINK